MIAAARTNNSATNITYAVWDAQTVGDNPEWREKFDKVVCFFALHWIPNQPKALRSILTCLKPGGEALLICVNREVVIKEGMQFLQSHPKWSGYLKEYVYLFHPWNRSVEETKDVFHQCGWVNVCPDLQSSGVASENVIKCRCYCLRSHKFTSLVLFTRFIKYNAAHHIFFFKVREPLY